MNKNFFIVLCGNIRILDLVKTNRKYLGEYAFICVPVLFLIFQFAIYN